MFSGRVKGTLPYKTELGTLYVLLLTWWNHGHPSVLRQCSVTEGDGTVRPSSTDAGRRTCAGASSLLCSHVHFMHGLCSADSFVCYTTKCRTSTAVLPFMLVSLRTVGGSGCLRVLRYYAPCQHDESTRQGRCLRSCDTGAGKGSRKCRQKEELGKEPTARQPCLHTCTCKCKCNLCRPAHKSEGHQEALAKAP